MSDTAKKLYDVARHLNALNNKGKVKRFAGNENGYAKIIEIYRGCSIWLHHEKNGDLIIDLLISQNAQKENPPLCLKSTEKFKEFFGLLPTDSEWNHSIDTHNDHERYYVSVNSKKTNEIIKIAEKLKSEFS